MPAVIKTSYQDTESMKKDNLSHYAKYLEMNGVDGILTLISEKAGCSIYVRKSGYQVFLSGSRALFNRFKMENEQRQKNT